MWWQSEFYKESQIRKTTPLTDDDKKKRRYFKRNN